MKKIIGFTCLILLILLAGCVSTVVTTEDKKTTTSATLKGLEQVMRFIIKICGPAGLEGPVFIDNIRLKG